MAGRLLIGTRERSNWAAELIALVGACEAEQVVDPRSGPQIEQRFGLSGLLVISPPIAAWEVRRQGRDDPGDRAVNV
jgi:hypothetical protein